MADPIDPALDYSVDLDSVADRLRLLNHFTDVQGVLAGSEAMEDVVPARPPAAFVGVASETGRPNQTVGGGHSQHIDVVLAVLFVEQSARLKSEANARAIDPLEITKRGVIRQLIGWTPRNAQQPLNFVGYRPIALGDGLAWGEARFSTSYRLTTA